MTTETIYHAVVKKHEGSAPQRMVFTAKDVPSALTTMAKLWHVHSTSDLHEFEILEVLGNNKYRQVAMKPGSKTKPHIKVPIVDDEPEPDVYEEAEYISYRLKVA